MYFTPRGGPLTGNAGALATTSALALLGVLAVLRRQSHRASRWALASTVILVAGLGPFLLRELARGVQIPPHGVDSKLWLIWEVPLFLAAVSVLLAGTAAGRIAARAASRTAAVGRAVRRDDRRRARADRVGGARTMAVVVRVPLGWRHRHARLQPAQSLDDSQRVDRRGARRDDAGVGTHVARSRRRRGARSRWSESGRFGRRAGSSIDSARSSAVDYAPTSRQALLQRFVASDIAAAGNPVALFAWPNDSGPVAAFATAQIAGADRRRRASSRARGRRERLLVESVPTDTSVELVMAAPSVDGGVTAVVMAPRSRLFEPDPFARLMGLDVDPEGEPPYTVRLRERAPVAAANGPIAWRRDGSELHGDWIVRTGNGAAQAHIEVELRPLNALIQRGALIVLLNLSIVGLLWMVSVIADGGGGRWFRARRRSWGRSYRARLSLALFAFFVIPATAFAIWSYEQLATDATQSRSRARSRNTARARRARSGRSGCRPRATGSTRRSFCTTAAS